MISVTDLHKSFGKVEVLKGMSCERTHCRSSCRRSRACLKTSHRAMLEEAHDLGH